MILSLRFSQKEGIFMKRSKIIAVFMVCVMVMAGNVQAVAYTFSQTRRESPQDFNEFLDDCTLSERIQIMQALQDLPSDYKNAKPETIIAAINSGRLASSNFSPEAIRKSIVWRAYNKMTYPFRSDKEIDYHGILQWAVGKADITARRINEYSTFRLEKEIAEEYFAKAWDKLTPEERVAVFKMPGAGAMRGAQAFGTMGMSPADAISILFMVKDAWDMVSAESDVVSDFIMLVNIIKTRKYAK